MGFGEQICAIGGKTVCPDIAPEGSKVVAKGKNTVVRSVTVEQAKKIAEENNYQFDGNYASATIEEPVNKNFFNQSVFILRLQEATVNPRLSNKYLTASFDNGKNTDVTAITYKCDSPNVGSKETEIFKAKAQLGVISEDKYIKQYGFASGLSKFSTPPTYKYSHCHAFNASNGVICEEISADDYKKVLLSQVPRFNNGELNFKRKFY